MNDESQPGRERLRTEQFVSVWSELGLPEPQPLQDGEAPPVELTLLRRLARRELPEHAARMAYHLVYAYAEWTKAYAQILVEEFPDGASTDSP